MTQQLGMMEEQEQQHQQHVADEDDGGVSVRLLPRSLHAKFWLIGRWRRR